MESQRNINIEEILQENQLLKEQLSLERSQTEDLFELLSVPLTIVGDDLRITRVNRAARKLLHISESEPESANFIDFLHDRDHISFREAFDQAQKGREFIRRYVDISLPDETKIKARIDIDPIVRDGRVKGARILLRNSNHFTAIQQELRESNTRYRNLVESIHDIIYRTDAAGTITYMNSAGQRILGYPIHKLVGKNINALIRDDYRDRVEKYYETQVRNGVKDTYYEFPVVDYQGETVWMGQISHLILNNSKVRELTAVARNITSRKKVEWELEEARRAAEAAQRTEKDFLVQMSHEIRTPLNAIVGMGHLLYDTSLSKKQKDYIDSIVYSGNLLTDLIRSVMDLIEFRDEKVELELESFELEGLAAGACKILEYKLEKKKVQTACIVSEALPAYVFGPRSALNQILLHLLSNAGKFTKEGEVNLKIDLVDQKNDQIRIRFAVEDTGIGIEPDKQKIIFESFRQARQDIHTNYGGSGLGLSVVHELINRLGGRIWVESQPGEGSTFYFELDFRETAENTDSPENTEMQNIANQNFKAKVLVAEDNPFNRAYLCDLLEGWNISFEVAEDGEEALKLIQKERFDMVLMDIQMPKMNGHEVTLQLREMRQSSNSKIPVVALSAGTVKEERDKAVKAGMNDYLSKPFTPQQLREKLEQWLGNHIEEDKNSYEDFGLDLDERLDRKVLQELYGEDLAYMWEMFNIFVQQMPDQFQELHLKQQLGDLEGLAKLSHKLKPSFAMVGYPKPGETLATITELARSGSAFAIPSLEVLVNGVVEEAHQLVGIVQAECDKIARYLHLDQG